MQAPYEVIKCGLSVCRRGIRWCHWSSKALRMHQKRRAPQWLAGRRSSTPGSSWAVWLPLCASLTSSLCEDLSCLHSHTCPSVIHMLGVVASFTLLNSHMPSIRYVFSFCYSVSVSVFGFNAQDSVRHYFATALVSGVEWSCGSASCGLGCVRIVPLFFSTVCPPCILTLGTPGLKSPDLLL